MAEVETPAKVDAGAGSETPKSEPEGTEKPKGTTVTDPPKESGKDEGPKDPAAKPETKTKEEAANKIVPEKYDLNLPEGSPLPKTAIEKVAALAKERGLSQKEAVIELERQGELANSIVEESQARLDTEIEHWVETAKKDDEIGGDAFDKNAELAKRVVSRFGTQALKDGLNNTGFGNHPELVRLLVRVGKAMSEDQLVLPGAGKTENRTQEDILYDHPSSKPKE